MARRLKFTEEERDERAPPLVLQIADLLVQEILSGRYTPGEPIREQEIADRFGASRGPVREALRLCEQDGLVEMLPWRGARVVNLTIEEVDDLFEVLSALLGLVAHLAAVHSSEAGIQEFADLVVQMEQSLSESADNSLQLALAFEAGAVLRKNCGSVRAGELLMRVGRLAYWQHRFMLDASLAWRKKSVRRYHPLIQALERRDPLGAERAARAIVAQSQAYVIDRLRHAYPGAGSLQRLPSLMRRSESD